MPTDHLTRYLLACLLLALTGCHEKPRLLTVEEMTILLPPPRGHHWVYTTDTSPPDFGRTHTARIQ